MGLLAMAKTDRLPFSLRFLFRCHFSLFVHRGDYSTITLPFPPLLHPSAPRP